MLLNLTKLKACFLLMIFKEIYENWIIRPKFFVLLEPLFFMFVYTIGITTVLTLLTLISSTNANMPKISYMKAIDVYLAGCFLFVFASLIEFAVVCYMDQQIPVKKESQKIKRQIDKSRSYEIQELLHSDIVLIRYGAATTRNKKTNL